MNHTVKKTLAKICKETHLKWDLALLIALLWIKVAPRSGLKLSSFEIVCGRPFQSRFWECLPPPDLDHGWEVKQYAQHSGQTLTILHKFAHCRSAYSSDKPFLHLFQLGDGVLLKTWKTQGPEQQLAEQWTGSYHALLTTHSSLKLMGIKPWIHHIWIKWAQPEQDSNPAPVVDAEKESWTCTGRRFEISISEEESRPQCRMTRFLYFINVFAYLGTFSCQILSLSVVHPIIKENKDWKWVMVIPKGVRRSMKVAEGV